MKQVEECCEISKLLDRKNVSIIDCGGGDDTIVILRSIKKSKLKDIIFLIPMNEDFDQFHNVKQTIELIQKIDRNAIILYPLNTSKMKSRYATPRST